MHKLLRDCLGRSPLRCCSARSLRPILCPWRPKNAEKSSRRWPTARCRTSFSRTRRNSTSSRWLASKITEFGLSRHPQRKGSSPDTKIRSLSWFGRSWQRPGGPLCFLCPLEPNWTTSTTSRYFRGLPAALGQETLPRSSLVPATGLCALSRFQKHPVLDSEENLIHKHGSLACKEPWP